MLGSLPHALMRMSPNPFPGVPIVQAPSGYVCTKSGNRPAAEPDGSGPVSLTVTWPTGHKTRHCSLCYQTLFERFQQMAGFDVPELRVDLSANGNGHH